MNNMNILNIGCGNKKMDGAINIDIYKFDSVDFVFDCKIKYGPGKQIVLMGFMLLT